MRRLYNAVCTWLEADAQSKGVEGEPQPSGDNLTQLEHGPGYGTQPEMHLANRGQSIDDDDGGVYRARLGFNNDHMKGRTS